MELNQKKKRRACISSVVRKEDAHRLLDQLAANATWDDLMHEIYVREAVGKGLSESKEGRTKDMKEIIENLYVSGG